jgi:hypothetical protein
MGGQFKTMVSNQSQCAETWELEDLITKMLPSNGSLCGTILIFWQVSYMSIWCCNSCLLWLHYSSLLELGGDTQPHRQQGDLISLLFFQNKESRVIKTHIPIRGATIYNNNNTNILLLNEYPYHTKSDNSKQLQCSNIKLLNQHCPSVSKPF